MKRVFLSLPMTGMTDEEIKKQIEDMKKSILKSKFFGEEAVVFVYNHAHPHYHPYGYVITDDYEEHGIIHRNVPAECRREPLLHLGHAVEQMAYVDYVFFGDLWFEDRGCCAERDVALSYNIPVADCSSVGRIFKENKPVTKV